MFQKSLTRHVGFETHPRRKCYVPFASTRISLARRRRMTTRRGPRPKLALRRERAATGHREQAPTNFFADIRVNFRRLSRKRSAFPTTGLSVMRFDRTRLGAHKVYRFRLYTSPFIKRSSTKKTEREREREKARLNTRLIINVRVNLQICWRVLCEFISQNEQNANRRDTLCTSWLYIGEGGKKEGYTMEIEQTFVSRVSRCRAISRIK